MRPRVLFSFAAAVMAALTLCLPAPAYAVWTFVPNEMYQVEHVCQDGVILDLGSIDQKATSMSILLWATDSAGKNIVTPTSVAVPPLVKPVIVPNMGDTPFFVATFYKRDHKLLWPARAVGTQVQLHVGPSMMSTEVVMGCSVKDRFDPFTVGYVWSHTPTPNGPIPATYTPDRMWSYNSTGGVNTVTKTGVGAYTVTFPGLAVAGGNAQVSTFGDDPALCKIAGKRWRASGTAMLLDVRCFGPGAGGLAKDSAFTASFTAGGGTANTYAFGLSDGTSQYNNTGGPITIIKQTVGSYVVDVPNVFGPVPGGSVKVTAVGDTATDCRLNWWGQFFGQGSDGAWHHLAVVDCFTSAGKPADQLFSFVYMDGMNLLGDNLMSDAYVWANQSSLTTAYPPDYNYQSSRTINQFGTVMIGDRYYEGPYDVKLEYQQVGRNTTAGQPRDGGDVQITSVGSGNTYSRCQVAKWGDAMWADANLHSHSGANVHVLCFDLDGNREDSSFALQYTAQMQ